MQNTNALHAARKAFVKAESSERIKRALRCQVQAVEENFTQGDKVYYKRDDSNRWRGPGKVIGQDGKMVFVRHGDQLVRVSTCRLVKVGQELGNKNTEKVLQEKQKPLIPEKKPSAEKRTCHDLNEDVTIELDNYENVDTVIGRKDCPGNSEVSGMQEFLTRIKMKKMWGLLVTIERILRMKRHMIRKICLIEETKSDIIQKKMDGQKLQF